MTLRANITLKRCGFTLIELLTAIAIAGVLVALLLPAIQSAREAARRTACANNLHQLGVAMLVHHDQYQRFPFGGWGHEWVGVAGRGSRESQPGSWSYSILPQLDQGPLHDLGGIARQADHYTRRLETPLPLFLCPSRRSIGVGPPVALHIALPKPAGAPMAVARGDYAINSGSSQIASHPGPVDFSQGDDPDYWREFSRTSSGDRTAITGISHIRYGVSLRMVSDGSSETYMLGEKYLSTEHYESGLSPGDNESLYSGFCTDLHRFAGNLNSPTNLFTFASPSSDRAEHTSGLPGFLRFGSAHPSTFGMAYCDGSVRWHDFEVDAMIHLRRGHRDDHGASLDALRSSIQPTR